MKAMVLAAGQGTRLRPLTLTTPKPMVPIANVPLLERTLLWLRHFGVDEVMINLYHLPEVIEETLGDGSHLGVKIRYSVEKDLLGTAGGVKKCQSFFQDEPFFVIYGDNVLDANLTRLHDFHVQNSAVATIALFRTPNPSACGLVITDDDGRVRRFQEKPPPEEVFTDLANAGVYLLDPEILDRIPTGVPYDFGKDVFPDLLDRNVYAQLLDGYIQDTGTPQQYRKANWDILNGMVREFGTSGPGGGSRLIEGSSTWVGENAEIAATAQLVGRNVIGSKVTIRAGARLENCIVWDGAVVEEDVHLSNAIVGYRAVVKQSVSSESDLLIGDDAVYPA